MTNTPESGTGPLTIDDAVNRLVAPAPIEDSPNAAPADEPISDDEDTAEEAASDTPEPEAAEDDGDGDEGADEAGHSEDGEDDFTLEIEGKKVNRDELKKGYLRQSDYTRKTQEVAEARKAVEAERQQVGALRQQYAQQLDVIAANLPQMQEPDWNKLYQEDPLEYAVQRERHRQVQEQRQAIRQEQQRIQAEQQREQQERFKQTLQTEARALIEAVPEWKDQQRFKKDVGEIRSFAKEAYGLTDSDLDTIYDRRAVLVLRDAMRYRAAQQQKAKVAEKIVDKPPVTMKPGTRPSKASEKQREIAARRQQLKKSGKVDDAVAVLLARSR